MPGKDKPKTGQNENKKSTEVNGTGKEPKSIDWGVNSV